MREPVVIERGRRDNRAGMPRPLAPNKGALRPVPWTNADEWGILDQYRAQKCEKGSLCLVCGKPVDTGFVFTAAKHMPVLTCQDDLEHAVDNGPLHERCAKMTVAHCAHIRQQLFLADAFMVPYERELSA